MVYDSSRLGYVQFVLDYDQLRILRSKRGNSALNNAVIEPRTTVRMSKRIPELSPTIPVREMYE